MKRRNDIKFISLIKDISLGTNMISLNNSFELLSVIKSIGFRILNAIGIKAGGYATRLNFMNKFARYLLYLRKNHGAEFVVAYLKAGQLAISKKVAHTPVKSLRDINPDFPLPRLANGLPHAIPISDRRLITQGGYSVIRFWLTMFSIYRIISIPGKLKLNTITDPFSGNLGWLSSSEALFESEAKKWISSAFELPTFRESELKMLSKASPSHTKSWKGYYTDIYHMPEDLYQTLIRFLQVSNQSRIFNYVSYIREITPTLSNYGNFWFKTICFYMWKREWWAVSIRSTVFEERGSR
jgi:hypothetical protein